MLLHFPRPVLVLPSDLVLHRVEGRSWCARVNDSCGGEGGEEAGSEPNYSGERKGSVGLSNLSNAPLRQTLAGTLKEF